jgi:molybdopterin converting factor small subunit
VNASTDQSSDGGHITLRYWASARAAAGVESDTVAAARPVTLSELLATARDLHADPRFAQVIASCSVMVGDRPVTSGDPDEVQVEPGSSVEFLPPFAGG